MHRKSLIIRLLYYVIYLEIAQHFEWKAGFFEIIRSYSTDKMSYSYQKQRTRAYDVDLRWRVIYQRKAKALGMTLETVARNLGVAVATVYTALKSYLMTLVRSVSANTHLTMATRSSLIEMAFLFYIEILLERPATYFKEIQLELIDRNATYICRCFNNIYVDSYIRMDLQGNV